MTEEGSPRSQGSRRSSHMLQQKAVEDVSEVDVKQQILEFQNKKDLVKSQLELQTKEQKAHIAEARHRRKSHRHAHGDVECKGKKGGKKCKDTQEASMKSLHKKDDHDKTERELGPGQSSKSLFNDAEAAPVNEDDSKEFTSGKKMLNDDSKSDIALGAAGGKLEGAVIEDNYSDRL